MATLTINGRKVKVDDIFLTLSPEEQEATVDEIAGSLGSARPREPHANVPEFDPGIEGYNPETGMVDRAPRSAGASFAHGAADTAGFGFGDEAASFVGSAISGRPREQVLREMRGNQRDAQADNPMAYLGGQVAGGVAQGLAAGPGVWANAASTAGRVAGGMLTGGAMGTTYGAGSGETMGERGKEALIGGGFGTLLGGAFPVVGAGLSQGYRAIAEALRARPIAQAAGVEPQTLRMLGNVLEADDSLGATGRANMGRAGNEAMLADAGPTASSMLDTAIQRSGRGAVVARDRIGERVTRDSQALGTALDNTLGVPQGVTNTRNAIREGSEGARRDTYNRAYSRPIDYSDPRAMNIENMVRNRVPMSAIQRANELMRIRGEESRQILARVADDGTVTFERMPDVRQLDYITRALNDLAQGQDGSGAFGRQNTLGSSYENLSRDIRSNLRNLVPEYGQALDTAADPIRRSQAVELGSRLLSPSMTRDAAADTMQGMSQAEREAVAQGLRSNIDDAMARVTRTAGDGDTEAREALKALKDLSSRANREKVALAIGDDQAGRLFDEMDRVAQSFNLRANVATNSRTYGRQAMDERVKDMTDPGAIGTALQGEGVNATKRIVQALTGRTPAYRRQQEDHIYAQIADLLTRQGGAGQNVYGAINQLGQTDQATQLMADRITRALMARNAYPATMLLEYRRDSR